MKKIGLLGLLIISSVYAEPGVESTQEVSINPTRLEKAKEQLWQVLLVGKQKTVSGCQWAWSHVPATPEPVKDKLNIARSWLALKSAIAKTWIQHNTPEKVQNWVSTVKDSCKPAWEKTHETISGWFTKLQKAFNQK